MVEKKEESERKRKREKETDWEESGTGIGEALKLLRLERVGEGGVSDQDGGWVGQLEAGFGQMLPQTTCRSYYQYSALLPHHTPNSLPPSLPNPTRLPYTHIFSNNFQ